MSNSTNERLEQLNELLQEMTNIELVQAERALEVEQLEREKQARRNAQRELDSVIRQYSVTKQEMLQAIRSVSRPSRRAKR